MLTGRLYIDGHDAYKKWGVYVVSGGWNELVAFPPLKSVESNDWQEEDGIEADASGGVLALMFRLFWIEIAEEDGEFMEDLYLDGDISVDGSEEE